MFEDALNAVNSVRDKIGGGKKTTGKGTFVTCRFSSLRSKNRLADVVWLNASTRYVIPAVSMTWGKTSLPHIQHLHSEQQRRDCQR